MTTELITVERAQMPSQNIELSFKRPVFGDYRQARKLYPSNTNNQTGPAYSVEELLFAFLLDTVNGSKLGPKDVAERLNPFPIKDRQFLILSFLEAFFLNQTQAKEARTNASVEANLEPKEFYTIPKEQMPSGTKSVTLRRPNTATQYDTDRKFQGVEVNGCTSEELLLAACIAQIDGVPVEQVKDIVSILDGWEIEDVFYANIYFVNLFMLDDSGTEQAKTLGKSFKAGATATKSTAKSKGTSVPA